MNSLEKAIRAGVVAAAIATVGCDAQMPTPMFIDPTETPVATALPPTRQQTVGGEEQPQFPVDQLPYYGLGALVVGAGLAYLVRKARGPGRSEYEEMAARERQMIREHGDGSPIRIVEPVLVARIRDKYNGFGESKEWVRHGNYNFLTYDRRRCNLDFSENLDGEVMTVTCRCTSTCTKVVRAGGFLEFPFCRGTAGGVVGKIEVDEGIDDYLHDSEGGGGY